MNKSTRQSRPPGRKAFVTLDSAKVKSARLACFKWTCIEGPTSNRNTTSSLFLAIAAALALQLLDPSASTQAHYIALVKFDQLRMRGDEITQPVASAAGLPEFRLSNEPASSYQRGQQAVGVGQDTHVLLF